METLKFKNFGYGDTGASRTKTSMKGFTSTSASPRLDIDTSANVLRQRGRMLYMGANIATSALKANRTNVVGEGLRLRSRVDGEVLGLSQHETFNLQKNIESEFALWAEKRRNCDATGVNDFYEMQQLVLLSWLMSGDVFAIRSHKEPTHDAPYSLRLKVIEADLVSTPTALSWGMFSQGKAENGNRIFDGVEIDDQGCIEAYYISNDYPNALFWEELKWDRIPTHTASGLPLVLHVMDAERPGQYRGVTLLAQVVEPLLNLSRYQESELTAAVIQSCFTGYVTQNSLNDDPFERAVSEVESASQDPSEYDIGPGRINRLLPGESINFFAPTRPDGNYAAFVNSVCEAVGAALEIPKEILLKSFTASYSAARGALLEAWKAFRMRRAWVVSDFCNPVFEMFLTEAVLRGRVDAPLYFVDPKFKAAYLRAEWVGPTQGALDPTKEIQAAAMAISEGLTTRGQQAMQVSGTDFASNANILSVENELLGKARQGLHPAELPPIQENEEGQ